MTDLEAGTHIAGHTVERLLGRGGMGNVYLARQESLGRTVAMKILHLHRARNPTAVEKFLREARASAHISHPHLITVHDVFSEGEIHGYTMEYVNGPDLHRYVNEHGPLGSAQVLMIGRQVAAALGHAHIHGVVHRDIKPANILIVRGGGAKVADLGLAIDRLEGQAATNASKRLMLVGTQEYCAPEQARNPSRAVPASDVFSLGATMFYALTGHDPWHGDTVIDLIVRMATEAPEFPPFVDNEVADLIDGFLSVDVGSRPQDGTEAVSWIEAVMRGEPLPRHEPTTDSQRRSSTQHRRGTGKGSRSRRRRRSRH